MTKNTKLPNIPFTYQGSKLSELKRLSPFIPNGSKIIEPFIGTGIVSYKFGLDNSCLGNDFNKDVWNIWRLAKGRDKEFFDLSLDMMQEENRTKEYYYSRRSEFNDKYFRSDEYNAERGAYYYFLLNSCHAGLVRYGPNGFNTSYKLFLLSGRKYHAHTRLELLKLVSDKFKEIQNFNAIDFLKYNEKHFGDFELIYLDPPYTQSGTAYINKWSDDNLMELDDYLHWAAEKFGIRSLMSNYHNEDLSYKGTILNSFDKKRLASTKITTSSNIIIEYGQSIPVPSLENFF